MTPLALFLSLASRLRTSAPTCDSIDPSRCQCGGWSRGHGVALALYRLAPVLRARRWMAAAEPASGPREKVQEYRTIPPGLTLGDGLLRTVRCHACGSVLRPGKAGPVTRERAGRWRHGRASGRCEARARVPRGGRTLEKLLRGSVVEVSRG